MVYRVVSVFENLSQFSGVRINYSDTVAYGWYYRIYRGEHFSDTELFQDEWMERKFQHREERDKRDWESGRYDIGGRAGTGCNHSNRRRGSSVDYGGGIRRRGTDWKRTDRFIRRKCGAFDDGERQYHAVVRRHSVKKQFNRHAEQ